MLMSRRGFLFGTAAALAATKVRRNPFLTRLYRHIAETGAPLLEVPARPVVVLDCHRELDHQFCIGDPYGVPDLPTWREHFIDTGALPDDGPPRPEDLRQLKHDWGFDPRHLDQEMDLEHWSEHYGRHASPNAVAYDWLDRNDIGPLLDEESPEPHLAFIDGYHPGNDAKAVHPRGDVVRCLSLLQHRLNQLGTGAAVRLI